jgi:hypothetical protein
MATRVLTSGSEFQVNVDWGGGNNILGNQDSPAASTDSSGLIVIAYESEILGDTTNNDPITNTISGRTFEDTYIFPGQQLNPAVAPLEEHAPGTSLVSLMYGIVFGNERHADGSVDANGPNITYRAIGSISGPLAIADFDGGLGHDALQNPSIATLSTFRQVVVFEQVFTAGADNNIFLNVVNAAGSATQFAASSPLVVEDNTSWQGNPVVAAGLSNQALVVYEDGTGTSTASANITARLFDGGSNTLGAAFTIADHAARLFTPSVAALNDTRYIIVYTDQNDIFARIWDPVTPAGAFLSAEFQIDTSATLSRDPSVAVTVDGGFIVTWADWNGSDYDVLARRFDAHGQSFGDTFTVNTLTDSSQSHPTIASSGSNVVIAWEDSGTRATDPTPTGVRGQKLVTTAFDYDSARIGDLDGNGRADILFQNDTRDVAVWQTNSAGAVSAISSFGSPPFGFNIFGTGDFNSTPGDDILLRTGVGHIAIWQTNGIAVGGVLIIGSTSPDYHSAGIGDFTGDGQDDLLFRNDAGQIVTWAIANNGLAQAPKVLGSASLAYHIVGIDDFTGDHQADILFRNDDGTIAVWQVANNQLLSAQAVGSTSTAYHVVATGDFDGNGAKDILFRSDLGELVEWLLDSTGNLLMSPTSIGTVSLAYHVDGAGDLNGDGRDDIILRHADGFLVEWLMNATSLAAPPAVMGSVAVDYAIAAHHFDLV